MERLKLSAEERTVGKKGLGVLRKKGLVPAILYGRNSNPLGLTLNAKELNKALGSEAGMNAVIELNLATDKNPHLVMIKDYQIHVLTHKIIHMDLLKIDIKQKVSVKIPVHMTGKSAGVTNGGILELTTRELEVQCLPTHIPSALEVDITKLEIGDSIHLTDLVLPEGVDVDKTVNLTIVSVAAPREEEPAAVPAAEISAGAVPVVGKEKEEGAAEEAGGDKKKAEAPKAEKK